MVNMTMQVTNSQTGRPSSASVIIKEFKGVVKGTLRGPVTAQMPSGMILHDCPVFVDGDQAWVSPPSKPQIDRDGKPIIRDGRVQYSQQVTFVSKELRNRFSYAVIAALRDSHPEVLA